MSRGGGRGGGRGGRGGGRGGRPNVPWDTGDEPDARPSELFPPYAVPAPRGLTTAETTSVHYMLLLRRQMHSSPLYTSKRTALTDPTAPRKAYGQAQMNAVYGVKNKASLDPFTSMPTYSEKFVREERALPDWSGRPVCRELFPQELLETVDGGGGGGADGPRKKRKLELSRVSAMPNAEEAFGMTSLAGHGGAGDGEEDAANGRTLLDRLEALRDDGDEDAEGDEEEAREEDEEDEIYDDEDAGDYDAEQFFDNGEDFGDEYGDGDDGGGEGTY
ncbi:DNA-directed RNA polymerase, III, C31 subunit [Cordyceps fumosorosea ARSEF 2679]|uniref:DNA-directed RNA polymerase III subunit n=1 Tax=Cordyceps fumosorosea (strain ARSEF 2679) TaxID=1081104 RepID=A0A168BPV3_CORFA|nr:DNA-directed RNA polymerase, III, C31 subunit [Cordyceps fumosorosea ARSEF 2679]OAA70397.1 DNA-directed RNA polymerase, III, C31 subunit [Cordyceps fumosorosea ARSEF 2679]